MSIVSKQELDQAIARQMGVSEIYVRFIRLGHRKAQSKRAKRVKQLLLRAERHQRTLIRSLAA